MITQFALALFLALVIGVLTYRLKTYRLRPGKKLWVWRCMKCGKHEESRSQPEWIAYDDLHVRWVSDLHDGIDFGGVKYCGLVRRRRRSEAVVDVEKEISACEEFLEQHGIVKEV